MNSSVFGRASVVAMIAMIAMCLWFAQTAPTHADVSASTTTSLPGFGSVPDVSDIFSTVRRISDQANNTGDPSSAASTTRRSVVIDPSLLFPDIGGLITSASTTASASSTGGLGSTITDAIHDALASTTAGIGMGSSTSGLGAQIADAITGGVNGTSNFGPFIKCGLIAPIGWPLPDFSSECNASTTNKARLTIIKNTVGGNGVFNFVISGSGSASSSITTTGGSGSVQFLASPGTFDIAEIAQDGWVQTSRVCASQHATSTGSASGGLGWSVLLTAGDDIVCTFVNTATSTATTTPGGGGGCTDNCGGGGGGGGCTDNCGGGGGSSGSGGASGGGGGGGSPSNGPVLGGGGFSPGEVLGNTIDMPGVPNTGAGGSADGTIVMLLVSFAIAFGGILTLRTMKFDYE